MSFPQIQKYTITSSMRQLQDRQRKETKKKKKGVTIEKDSESEYFKMFR